MGRHFTGYQRKVLHEFNFEKKYISHRVKGDGSRVDVDLSSTDSGSESEERAIDLTQATQRNQDMPDVPQHPKNPLDTPIARQTSNAFYNTSKKRKAKQDEWVKEKKKDRETFERQSLQLMDIFTKTQQPQAQSSPIQSKHMDVDTCLANIRALFDLIEDNEVRSHFTLLPHRKQVLPQQSESLQQILKTDQKRWKLIMVRTNIYRTNKMLNYLYISELHIEHFVKNTCLICLNFIKK